MFAIGAVFTLAALVMVASGIRRLPTAEPSASALELEEWDEAA